MEPGSLLILTGPPGAGKTTVGRIVAARSPRSVSLSADWFWTTIVRGHTPPWEGAADDQNQAMIRSAVAAAVRMADAGYATVLEGIIGPWHFGPVQAELAARRVPVHYVVLRPAGETCLVRARRRVAQGPEHRDALTEETPIRHLWSQFSDLGALERHVIDSSDLDPRATAQLIHERIATGELRLPVDGDR